MATHKVTLKIGEEIIDEKEFNSEAKAMTFVDAIFSFCNQLFAWEHPEPWVWQTQGSRMIIITEIE